MSVHDANVKYITPDPRPPFTVRRMPNGAPTHIVAKDGFSIIATVNRDENGNAEMLAAAPDMRAALDHPALLELFGTIEGLLAGPIIAAAVSASTEATRLLALVRVWKSVRGDAIAKAQCRS